MKLSFKAGIAISVLGFALIMISPSNGEYKSTLFQKTPIYKNLVSDKNYH